MNKLINRDYFVIIKNKYCYSKQFYQLYKITLVISINIRNFRYSPKNFQLYRNITEKSKNDSSTLLTIWNFSFI